MVRFSDTQIQPNLSWNLKLDKKWPLYLIFIYRSLAVTHRINFVAASHHSFMIWASLFSSQGSGLSLGFDRSGSFPISSFFDLSFIVFSRLRSTRGFSSFSSFILPPQGIFSSWCVKSRQSTTMGTDTGYQWAMEINFWMFSLLHNHL